MEDATSSDGDDDEDTGISKSNDDNSTSHEHDDLSVVSLSPCDDADNDASDASCSGGDNSDDDDDDNDNRHSNAKHARTMRSTREPAKQSTFNAKPVKAQPNANLKSKPKGSRKLARPLDDEFMEASRGDWRCWGGIDY